MEKAKLIAQCAEKMTAFLGGSRRDINHFLKVWSYTRAIAMAEGVDSHTLFILEITAIVHDISCKSLRERFGFSDGKKQEEESPELLEAFFSSLDIDERDRKRIIFLVSHHHTSEGVDAPDWQILLEADYLVNAGEHNDTRQSILSAEKNLFRTETGIRLLRNVYSLSEC